jgi:two-component SAPR family response regulator
MDLPAVDSAEILALVQSYTGQFCPEFEYDEWAIAWRARVHATYLDLAHRGIRVLSDRSQFDAAQAVASSVLSVDRTAIDIERKLVWLYAKAGSSSAASAQYQHLAAEMRADGLTAPPLDQVIRQLRPT